MISTLQALLDGAILVLAYLVTWAVFFAGSLLGPGLIFVAPLLLISLMGLIRGAHEHFGTRQEARRQARLARARGERRRVAPAASA